MSQVQLITPRNIITADNYFDNFYICHEMITTHMNIYFQNVLTVSYVCPHIAAINTTQNIEHQATVRI